MNDTTLGIIAAAVPLIIIGFLALRRMPWIFAFFVALVAVGLGYLHTTGAVKEFGHKVRVALPAGVIPEHRKADEAVPADNAAMKATIPTAPEAGPATPPAADTTPTPPSTPESTPESTAPAPTPTPAPANP